MQGLKKTAAAMGVAVVLAIGFFVVWMCTIGMLAANRASLDRQRNQEMLVFTSDGAAAIQHTDALGDISWTTLSGEPTERRLDGLGSTWLRSKQPEVEPAPLTWPQRARVFADDRRPHTEWTLLYDGEPDGHAYFVGYDSSTNGRIGYLGLHGFSAEEPDLAKQFPIRRDEWDLNGVISSEGIFIHGVDQPQIRPHRPFAGETWLLAHGKAYRIDFDARSVVEPFQSRRPLRSITRVLQGRPQYIFLSDEQLFMFPEGVTHPEIVDLPPELQGINIYWVPRILQAKDDAVPQLIWNEGIAYSTEFADENPEQGTERAKDRLYWLGPQGVTRTAEAELDTNVGTPNNWVMPLIMPCPAMLDYALATQPPRRRDLGNGKLESYDEAWRRQLDREWPQLVSVHVLGLACALIANRRQTRFAMPRGQRLAWAVFVFFFGLPGLVGYLTHRKWPIRQPCPSCARVVPRDREFCAACRQEFPLPEMQGIEIFA